MPGHNSTKAEVKNKLTARLIIDFLHWHGVGRLGVIQWHSALQHNVNLYGQ